MEAHNKENDFMSSLPSENPFKVPDGYFDRFSSRMADRIVEENQTSRFPFPALLRPIPILGFASMMVIVSVLAIKHFSASTAPLTDEEISTYVYQEGIIEEMDLDELIEYSSVSFADTTKKGSKHKSEEEQNEIEKYLIDEDIDLNDIINEL